MLPLSKFIKPWKDAGEANALFAPCAFVDEHSFLTKTGAIGVMYELAEVRHESNENWAKSFRISSGSSRVYTTFAIKLKMVREVEAELTE